MAKAMRPSAKAKAAEASAAGYSGTPLPKKLEIKANTRVATVGAPSDFPVRLGTLPEGAVLRRGLLGPRDLTIWFVTSRRQLEGDFHKVAPLKGEGSLWIAWPKKTSGVKSDLTEDILRAVILPHGLVDRKVCAIDATWSGLRLVVRKELR